MLAKICSFSNFGSLSPNLTWVFTYGNSIANFRVARYRKTGSPEIGNTVVDNTVTNAMPDLDSATKNYYINYFKSLILEIYSSANCRNSAFLTFLVFKIWQPGKNFGCYVKTDFIFEFCIKTGQESIFSEIFRCF